MLAVVAGAKLHTDGRSVGGKLRGTLPEPVVGGDDGALVGGGEYDERLAQGVGAADSREHVGPRHCFPSVLSTDGHGRIGLGREPLGGGSEV